MNFDDYHSIDFQDSKPKKKKSKKNKKDKHTRKLISDDGYIPKYPQSSIIINQYNVQNQNQIIAYQEPQHNSEKLDQLQKQLTKQKRKMQKRENKDVWLAKCLPRNMKKAKGEFVIPLRENLEHMMMAHFAFMLMELFVYNIMVLTILTEIFYFWLCYFCYMTLKYYAFYAYILLMGFAPLYSIWTLLTIGPIKMLFYIIQLFVYSYFGGYITFLRYRKYAQELNEYEQEKKNRLNPINVKDTLEQIQSEQAYEIECLILDENNPINFGGSDDSLTKPVGEQNEIHLQKRKDNTQLNRIKSLANMSDAGNEKRHKHKRSEHNVTQTFKNIFRSQDNQNYQEQDQIVDDNAYMQFQEEGYQNPYVEGYYGGQIEMDDQEYYGGQETFAPYQDAEPYQMDLQIQQNNSQNKPQVASELQDLWNHEEEDKNKDINTSAFGSSAPYDNDYQDPYSDQHFTDDDYQQHHDLSNHDLSNGMQFGQTPIQSRPHTAMKESEGNPFEYKEVDIKPFYTSSSESEFSVDGDEQREWDISRIKMLKEEQQLKSQMKK